MVVLALFRNLKGPPGFTVEENICRSSYNHKAENCILRVQGPARFAILMWPAAMSLQFQCQGRRETGFLKSIIAPQLFLIPTSVILLHQLLLHLAFNTKHENKPFLYQCISQ